MPNLQSRLKRFILHKDLAVYAFENQCGLAQGTVSKTTDKTRPKTIERIARAFPDLNIEWLRTGEGEMLRPVPAESYEIGVGVGKQQGGKSEFKVEIKEDDQERKSDEQATTDLRRDIDLLKARLQDRERTIETLTASVARLEKINDFLMQQISQK